MSQFYPESVFQEDFQAPPHFPQIVTVTLQRSGRSVPRDSTRQPGKQEEEEEEATVLALCHAFPALVSSSFVLMLFSPDPEIFSAFKPKFSNS